MNDAAGAARRMWTLFEPVHVVTYFTAEARAGFEQAGLRATDGLDCAGRVLAAANAALPVPEEPAARVWHAATLLREHRGDGHSAALLTAGIDGCEALVLRAGSDLSRELLQPVRGWAGEDWDRAAARLTSRGWLGEDGRVTPEGTAVRQAVEDATDRAAARPWDRLGAAATEELAGLLAPVARACATELPFPNPVGVPAPPAGGSGGLAPRADAGGPS